MTEIIADSGFVTLGAESSLWAIIVHEGVRMVPVVRDGVLALEIAEARGANWHGELRYAPFRVSRGAVYEVAFEARARKPFSFSVWLGQRDEPWASLVPEENHFGARMMTGEWQRFAHTWRPFLDEEAARLNFVLGQMDNGVEIRAVSLREVLLSP